MPKKDLQELMEEWDDAEEYVKQKAMDIADSLLDGETPNPKALETYKSLKYEARMAEKAYYREVQRQHLAYD